MSDTPETDHLENELGSAAKFSHPVIWRHARELEIERDEARAELYDIRLNLGADAEGYTLIHAVCVLQQERDEAREKMADALQEVDLRTLDFDRMKQERDEARDAMETCRRVSRVDCEQNAKRAEQYHVQNLTLERERDEAREQAHRFRSLHYSHLGINGSASWFPWESKLGHE